MNTQNTQSIQATQQPAISCAGERDLAGRKRGTGAMFLSGFGTLWLGAGMWSASHSLPALAVVAALGLLLLGIARRQAGGQAGDASLECSAEQEVIRKRFNRVNALQWVGCTVVVAVLNLARQPQWITAGIMFIVGWHFLPLAKLFRYPAHYVTGGALMAVALAYPWLSAAGPLDPVGPIAAGMVLWTSAVRMLWIARRSPRLHRLARA